MGLYGNGRSYEALGNLQVTEPFAIGLNVWFWRVALKPALHPKQWYE